MISFIIVNYNTSDLCDTCIYSIVNNKSIIDNHLEYEIIVVDNQSNKNHKKKLKDLTLKYSNIDLNILELNHNYGFGYANNRGVNISKGDTICLVNSDVTVIQTNFEVLITKLAAPNIGSVSSYILNKNKSFQSLGFSFPKMSSVLIDNVTFRNFNFRKKYVSINFENKWIDVDWISGCFLLITKRTYEKINGFDENIFMYSEDLDLGYKLKNLNLKNTVSKSTYVIHDQKKSVYKKGMFHILWERKKNYFYVLKKHNHFNIVEYNLIKLSSYFNLLTICIFKKLTS